MLKSYTAHHGNLLSTDQDSVIAWWAAEIIEREPARGGRGKPPTPLAGARIYSRLMHEECTITIVKASPAFFADVAHWLGLRS